jgi:outer membrane biosynthesis protein TonB
MSILTKELSGFALFLLALIVPPAFATPPTIATSELYKNLETMESRAEEDLQRIRQMIQTLESTHPHLASSRLHSDTARPLITEPDKYSALILDKLDRAWSPPSSASKDMNAGILISLLPTGEAARIKLFKGSGSSDFDERAVQAFHALGRFPVPADQRLFNSHFRNFEVDFNAAKLKINRK